MDIHSSRNISRLKSLHLKTHSTRATTIKGRMNPPKRMFFSEKFQMAFDPPPPPRFRKIILQIFSRIHDQSTVYNGKNLQHKFLDWKWHPSLLWNFSKNSSDLLAGPFPLRYSLALRWNTLEKCKMLTRTTRSNSTMVTPTSNRPHRIFIDIQCVHTSLLLVSVILNPEGMIKYEVSRIIILWN